MPWNGSTANNIVIDAGNVDGNRGVVLDAHEVTPTAPPPLYNAKNVAQVDFYVKPGHGLQVKMTLRPQYKLSRPPTVTIFVTLYWTRWMLRSGSRCWAG